MYTFNGLNSKLTNHLYYDLGVDNNGLVWLVQTEYDATRVSPDRDKVNYHINIINPLNDSILTLEAFLNDSRFNTSNISQVYLRNKEVIIVTTENKIFRWTNTLEELATNENLAIFYWPGKGGYYELINQHLFYTSHQDTSKKIPLDFKYENEGGFIQTNLNGELIGISPNQKNLFVGALLLRDTTKLSIEHFNYPGAKLIQNRTNTNMFFQFKVDNRVLTKAGTKIFLSNDKKDLLSSIGYSHLSINSLSTTTSGSVLVGTDIGVFIIDLEPYKFNTFMANDSIVNSVRGLYISKDVSYYRAGVYYYLLESKSGKYKFLNKHKITSGRSIATNKNNSSIWYTSDLSGLKHIGHIDLVKEKIYPPKRSQQNAPASLFYSDLSNTLYIYSKAIEKTGPTLSNIELLDSYTNHYAGKQVICNHITSCENHLWLGTDYGLLKYNEKQDTFQDILQFEDKSTQIEFVHFDKSNDSIIWLATQTHGLLKWNRHTNKSYYYNTSNGFSSNNVHCLHEDKNNILWASTNHNLHSIDKTTNRINIYTTDEGISHSEFNRDSYFYDKETGDVYFGGLNGYTYFNPDSLNNKTPDPLNPRLINAIVTYKDFSTRTILQDLHHSKTLSIDKNIAFVELEFATDDHMSTKNMHYSYRLPEVSKEWTTQKNNIIKLANLPYGNYNFDLIPESKKTNKSAKIYNLNISFPTPLLKQTWLKVTLVFIALLLIYAYLKWKTLKLMRKTTELEAAIKERTIELDTANKSKSKLFAILAHDLRNPLASLSNLAKKIDFLITKNRITEVKNFSKEVETKVESINENLNNILYWALLEDGKLSNNPERLNILKEIKTIESLFREEIISKNIVCENNINETLSLNCDKSIFQSIMRNGLSNAVKFCPPNGIIAIQFYNNNNNKIIEINNTYNLVDQGRSAAFGSGVGLRITEELASLAGINLSLELNFEGLTKFRIHF